MEEKEEEEEGETGLCRHSLPTCPCYIIAPAITIIIIIIIVIIVSVDVIIIMMVLITLLAQSHQHVVWTKGFLLSAAFNSGGET